MLGTYEVYQAVVFHLGGAAVLGLGYCWLGYRLMGLLPGSHVTYQPTSICFATFVRGYGFFFFPWVVALVTYRIGGVSLAVSGAGLGAQLWLLGAQFGAAWVFAQKLALGVGTRWTLELGGAWLTLQLSWLCLSQSNSLLTMLLWFEVASLSGLLLLSTLALSAADVTSPGASWRGVFVGHQAQVAFLQATLVFLWTSGVATLLLLWGLCGGLLFGGGVTPDLLTLAQAYRGGVASPASQVTVWIGGVGVLVKLLLQPSHLGLLTFYRRLRLEALVGYVLFYYCFFVPAFICVFVPYLYMLVANGVLVFVALLLGSSLMLSQGSAVGVDLRVALVFSTAVNLTLLLLILGLR